MHWGKWQMSDVNNKDEKKISQTTFIVTIVILVALIGIVSYVVYNQSQNVNVQYGVLQSSYSSLQSQFNSLQNLYNNLMSNYSALQATPGLTYDITDFGAVPNDQNDDSNAFQQILSAHPSNIQIHVPCGTFMINTTIHLNNNNNVTIFGEGSCSILKLSAPNNIIWIEGSKNVIIKDLVLDGNSQKIPGEYMGITAGFLANDLQINNVYIYNTTGDGIQVCASKNTIITNCRIESTGEIGINSHESGWGVCLNSVDGARITNNRINGYFGDDGIGVGGWIEGFPMSDALIDNNTITGAHTDNGCGIGVGSSNYIIITNNKIHDEQVLGVPLGGTVGIYTWGGSNLMISNNEVYRTTAGIEIDVGANVIAANNYVHNFTSNRMGAGFFICTANTLLENNTIEDATMNGIFIVEPDELYATGMNELIINNTIKDSIGSAGIRVMLLTRDKMNLAIIGNTLINNNPWGIYMTGSGRLINPIFTGNTITGSQIPFLDHTPTNLVINP
jgi:parallel beta-helix repeat protein